jgi:MFS family permease
MAARAFSALAYQMLAVAVGWQMYALTRSAFYLGLVGLVQFLPMIILTLISGHVADRYNRKLVISVSQVVAGLAVLLLVLGNLYGWINEESILMFVFLIGIANSFQGPSMQALLPNIVSKDVFPRAAALMASVWQFAVIVGPGLGGILYSFGPTVVYSVTGISLFLSGVVILFVSVAKEEAKSEYRSLKTLFAGVSFIRSKPAILGAISLDLFAVLFGGATALLPIYASTILMIGPFGLGVLRSAPAAGALLMSVFLARKPLKKRVGRTMFTAVMFFGIATVIFAISTSFIISLLALFVLGAADAISVVIRSTFVQIETPDNLRGRVSSANQLFIGTSNQLGEFESGLTATWFGTVPAVLLGGIGTLVVALLWMKLFPSLFHVDQLAN